MDALARALCGVVRWCGRTLQLRRRQPPWPLKLAVAAVALVLYSWFAPALALLHLLGARLVCEAQALHGARFRCDVADLIQGYICFFGVWEPDVTAFLERTLRPGATVVDVGANVGYDTLLASTLVGPTGRVVAIEASPSIHRALQENLALNGDPPQVRPIHAAVSGAAGTAAVYRGPRTNLGQTTTAPRPGQVPEAEVPAAPLLELLRDEERAAVRLIKIDVEGTEREILADLARGASRLPPEVELVVELSPGLWPRGGPPADEVLRPFREQGFHVYRLSNSYWLWHALWPADARPARRLRTPLDPRAGQLDLVLSRRDEEWI